MAFKRPQKSTNVPASPDQLLRELPRRKIPDVLPHQRELMRSYAAVGVDEADVAMQLPTGSGKTLVGLLTAEWLRRKNKERMVYLCPTRQLVHQVVEQAEEKYGLTVLSFVGRVRDYDPTAKAKYQNADHVAVTTYSSLFNTNPYFATEDVLILDDAQAAENYVASGWTLIIDREENATLHTAFRVALRPHLDPTTFSRLSGHSESPGARAWVDKLPTPTFREISDQITEVLDAHTSPPDQQQAEWEYKWSMLHDHLTACHVYLSSREILIRPLIPPTWAHSPFSSPRQRIYMSATLGAGGDLERLMGRRSILRLPIPEGWDRQGVGRRFFIFPGMSLKENQIVELRHKFMERSGRSLVLVPREKERQEIANDIRKNLQFKTFSAEDIEKSKSRSSKSPKQSHSSRADTTGSIFPGRNAGFCL